MGSCHIDSFFPQPLQRDDNAISQESRPQMDGNPKFIHCTAINHLLLTATLFTAGVHAQTAAAQQGPTSPWHYGGFADLAYLYDFNSPANHLFRDRGTAA